ncbi:MAG: hypothetical protein ACR2OJ_08240 [Hyphomicrobiales bacterium]
MKLEREDLNAAVENRILSAEQADALQEFLAVRNQTPRAKAENFRVTNNFGEIFISLGLIIMFMAMIRAVGIFDISSATSGTLSSVKLVAIPALAALFWAFAEFFTYKRPQLLPAVTSAILFVVAVTSAASLYLHGNPDLLDATFAFENTWINLVRALAFGLVFMRFKLPMLLLFFAAAAAQTAFVFLSTQFPALPYNLILGVCGLAILLTAIWLDTLDPLRNSKTTAYAFWLFIIGSPMTIHPIFFSVLMSGEIEQTVLIVFICALSATLLGLLLDRRSLVASSLIYFTISIGYMNSQIPGTMNLTLPLTALIIGTGIVLIGVFWYPIRSLLMGKLPQFSFLEKLPPYA